MIAMKKKASYRELAIIAVKQNKQAYHFIAQELQQDEEIKAYI